MFHYHYVCKMLSYSEGNFLLIIAKSAAKVLHGLNVLTEELWL